MKVDCPYCNNPAQLVTGEKIYPHKPGLAKLKFWRCVPCSAYVGVHGNSNKNPDDNTPLGRLANAELRLWKQKAHVAFDPLWKSRRMTRSEAYAMLAEHIGIKREECHIGMFDVEQCKAAERIAREYERETER